MSNIPTAEVPSSIDDVTAQWLTQVLGTDVTDVRAEQIAQDSGFSSLLYRVHITGGADAPSTLIVKLPARSEARAYLGRLAAHGITDYSFNDAWRHYRSAVAYLIVLPVITLIGWDAMPERSRQLCLKLTERAVLTIDDIGAREAIE